MVGFVIGLLVGAMLGFTLMACLKVGGDDLEQYYIDLIQTYDKEVNRQYKCISEAIEFINDIAPWEEKTEDGDIIKGKLIQDDYVDILLDILKGVDKE